MEVLIVIMSIILYFLLDRSDSSTEVNGMDFIDEKK